MKPSLKKLGDFTVAEGHGHPLVIPVCVVSNHFWWFHILAHLLYPNLYVFLCTMLVFAFCWMDVLNLDFCFHFKLVIILNYQKCDFLSFVQLHKFSCFQWICCNMCYKASLVLKCRMTWICFGFVGWSNFVLCYSQILFCLTHNTRVGCCKLLCCLCYFWKVWILLFLTCNK
jgi:hypothetical protein